jgi:hypothetical protein
MDTNVALWSLAAPERLSKSVRKLLEDPRQRISFSSITIVEFELKRERLLSNYGGLTTNLPTNWPPKASQQSLSPPATRRGSRRYNRTATHSTECLARKP